MHRVKMSMNFLLNRSEPVIRQWCQQILRNPWLGASKSRKFNMWRTLLQNRLNIEIWSELAFWKVFDMVHLLNWTTWNLFWGIQIYVDTSGLKRNEFVCLVRRLLLCEELDRSSCGSVLFHGYLPPPGKTHLSLLDHKKKENVGTSVLFLSQLFLATSQAPPLPVTSVQIPVEQRDSAMLVPFLILPSPVRRD